jgi:uncharacterized protein (TIGR03067 family)
MLATAFLLCDSNPIPELDKEVQKLGGTWVLERIEESGHIRDLTELRGRVKIVFTGQRCSLGLAPAWVQECPIRLGRSGNRKTIDFDFSSRPLEGCGRLEGIYEFEGNTLRICVDTGKRPTKFATSESDSRVLWVFARDERKDREFAASVQREQQALQGCWKVVAVEAPGVENESERDRLKSFKGRQVRLTGDPLKIIAEGETKLEILVDPTTSPKKFSVVVAPWFFFSGVYSLEGDVLDLWVGDGADVDYRPKELPVQPVPELMNFRLQRMGKKRAQP